MRKGSNYDKMPVNRIAGAKDSAWHGYEAIGQALRKAITGTGNERCVVAVDCYPGVRDGELLPALKRELRPALTIQIRDANLSDGHIENMLARNLTD
ncbi:MAG: mannose-6-phosphate isomerase, partial [Eubacteriales bacterium]|nr:mannose-6-phosphate isomerase [Eubacteriales bacterium]